MSTKYSVTLTWNSEKTKLVFPVLPEKISVKKGVSNSKIDVAELGQIYEKGTPDCAEYSWDSILPLYNSSVVSVGSLSTPRSYVTKIENLMKDQTVVHLVVAGTGITEYCLITDFSYYEEGGDVGTIHYSITLKEYRTVNVRKLTTSTAKKTTSKTRASTTSSSSTSKTYKVKSGDCLWSIAQAKLGDGSKWTKIYDLNESTIKSAAKKNGITASKNNPIIFTGTVLKLPS